MQNQTVHIVSKAIRYIEDNLYDKLALDEVAAALHYSKFYLHRIFKKTTGLTIHDYIRRRQITEAAKLLVYSEKPILEIAFISGYGSQQAFSDIFKAMYKAAPSGFRKAEKFYPLQLEMHLNEEKQKTNFTKDEICFASDADIEDWMELVRLSIDGYPHLNENEYLESLSQSIENKEALILRDINQAAGIMAFSANTGIIEFLAVHPQYRDQGITKLFLNKLITEVNCSREISITTYRADDRADTGYREEYHRLGFSERELLVEYGYPVQRFVLSPGKREGISHE